MTKPGNGKQEAALEIALEIERVIGAPRDVVWRCWTQPDLLKQWYCPAPWKVTHAEIDLRAGGAMNCVMEGPNDGERHEITGMLLEVVPHERLTFTDGYSAGFMPRPDPFMTGYVRLSDHGDGRTKMVWGARHTSVEDKQKHLDMGFEEGWTAAAGQLDELARSLADERDGPRDHAPETAAKARTCLWFDGNGHEAAEFYVSLLADSHIETVLHPKPGEPPLVVEFTLAGAPMMVLNGGPQFTHSEAASISVLTKDQQETDRLWSALTADGGSESKCAWLKDKYGVSWQIVPAALPRMLASDDRAAAGRAMAAMMQMRKIDIAAIHAAFDEK